jgi:glycosyltransferase involved in cell wall biosynthesis
MNVAYLVWLENLSTPILTGQVIDLLEEMGRRSSRHKLHLFAFQPFHRVLLRYAQLQQVRRRLETCGVKMIVIPCLSLPTTDLFRARWYMLPLVLIQSLPSLLLLTLVKRIEILHCRSYPICWAALWVKRLTGVRVAFDPRSDFPEENVTAGLWTDRSFTHRLWKRLEAEFVGKSDATIAISQTYIDHFGAVSTGATFRIIPNNVDTNRFRRDKAFRLRFRHERGMGDDTIVFCYSGTLGGHWHSPEPYAKYIISLRALKKPHWFLFITPDTEALQTELGRNGVGSDEYGVVTSGFGDVHNYLSAADFGLMLTMRFTIALRIKTVEYLSMGLPVITNRASAGTSEIVGEHDIGLVIEEASQPDLARIEAAIERKDELSSRCRAIAVERFSTAKVAELYAGLYDALATSESGS